LKKINPKTFEKNIVLRRAHIEDYEQLKELSLLCYPKIRPWNREEVESQITTFPEGQICIDYGGKIVATCASLIVDFDLYSDWHNWKHISGEGFIRNHNPNGDTLYGIEIMVHPDFRGMKLARRLYDARKLIVKDHNLRRFVIGGRIPGYHKYSDKMSADEYVRKVIQKELADPVLTAHLSNGFALVRLIPDYMPSDEDSAGYATHMEWLNLDYVPPSSKKITLVEKVRLCSVQYQLRSVNSFEEFEKQSEFFVDVASDYRCDFVLFPELFTTQLLSFTPASQPAEAARHLAAYTPRFLECFTSLAVNYNVNIVGGSTFTLEDEKLYNTSWLFRRDGSIGRQEKMHITPAERRWWGLSPGRKVEVFDTDRDKVGITVCYDVEFPEIARYMANKGAKIIFCPFNTDNRQAFLRVRLCAQTRCIENHIYVATAGCVGNLPFIDNSDIHYAQSGIFTPSDVGFSRDGVAAECEPNMETTVMHDLDLEQLRKHRYTGNTLNWNDRRKDLYKIVFVEDGKVVEV
jgi:predicted amidohydrolase/ribosomal protein S18 acetylase RimI-like enzyme